MRGASKGLVIAALIAVVVFGSAASSEAGWGHRAWATAYWGWGCCSPCWTVACDPCCDWGWGWGGGWGHKHWRRAAYWGCATSICDPCWGGAYAAPVYGGAVYGGAVAGCCGDTMGTVLPVAPAVPGAPIQQSPTGKPTLAPPQAPTPGPVPAAPGAAPEAPARTSTETLRPDAGLLTIWVPEDAKVFVNGYQTKSTGNLRKYISHGLKAGFTYNYEVRAVVTRDGRDVEETQKVVVLAGQRSTVAFSFAKSGASLASVW